MNVRKHIRRSLKRNIWLLITIEFFAELRLYFPVAVIAFESLMGSYTMAMGIFAVATAVMTLAEVPTGILSDKWGRRGTLILGSITEASAVGLYTLAFVFVEHHIFFLYLGAILYGVSGAFFSGNNHAMVYETLAAFKREKEVGKILGRISSLGQVGLAISGIVAGLLVWHGTDYKTLMFLTLPSLFMTILLACLTVEPPVHCVEDRTPWQHMKKAAKLLAASGKLRLLTMTIAMQQGAGLSNYYFTPSFIESVWPAWMTPVYRTGQHTIGAIGFWFSGTLTKRFGAIRVLLGGTVVGQSLYLIGLTTANFFSPFVMMLSQATYASSTTAERVVQQETFSDAQRATMGSLISFISGIFSAVFCLLMGWVSDLTTPAFAMLSLFLCRAVIVDWLYIQLYTKHR